MHHVLALALIVTAMALAGRALHTHPYPKEKYQLRIRLIDLVELDQPSFALQWVTALRLLSDYAGIEHSLTLYHKNYSASHKHG